MSLTFRYMRDVGSADTERVVLHASTDLNLGDYCLLVSSRTSDGSATSGAKPAYWFPDHNAEKGDTIVVYTKSGTNKVRKNDSGAESHFFYWGRSTSLWNVEKNGVVILQASVWTFFATKEET